MVDVYKVLGMETFRQCLTRLYNEEQPNDEEAQTNQGSPDNNSSLQGLLEITTTSSDGLCLGDEDGLMLFSIFEKIQSKKEKELFLMTCAELSKVESNRELLVSCGILKEVLKGLDTDDDDLLLQTLRVVGNSCIDCEAGREEVLKSGYLPVLVGKLKLSSAQTLSSKLPTTLYGCLANIAADNEAVQKELVRLKGVESCVAFLKESKEHDVTSTIMAINAISGLICQGDGQEQLRECGGFHVLVSLISPSVDPSIMQAVLDIVGDFAEEDDFRDAACEAGLVPSLVNYIEEHPCFKTSETKDDMFKLSTDTVVLMTSGEKSFDRIKDDHTLLQKFSEWFNSANKHIQTSAGLAICNYARSESMCVDLVKGGIHEMLVAFIGSCMGNIEECSNQLQAACSAIKNLVIPVGSKAILGATPLPMYAVDLVMNAPSPVQYKALAILRLLVQDQSPLAVKLCDNLDFLTTIAQLSEVEIPVGLAAEAQRTIAALVKNCKSTVSIAGIVECNGIMALTSLLKAEHVLMQNEAIIALITILQGLSASIPFVLKSDCVEFVRTLMASSTTEQGVLFNILAFLTILNESDPGREYIKASDIEPLVETLTHHSQHMVRSRASDLLAFLRR